MKRIRDDADPAAGRVAAGLLRLLTAGEVSSATPWIDALAAEKGEIGTGRSQLLWALGGLGILIRQGLSTMARRWRVRLRWVASAGGLGGLRVYLPAVAGGLLMAVGSLEYRDADAPVAVVAAVLLTPYYVVVGLWWGRTGRVETAALVGAITAFAGFEIFATSMAILVAATESALNALTWLGFGVLFALLLALMGAICGLIGGTLAHPAAIVRSVRR